MHVVHLWKPLGVIKQLIFYLWHKLFPPCMMLYMQLGGSFTFAEGRKEQVRDFATHTNLSLLVSCVMHVLKRSEQHVLSSEAGFLLYLSVNMLFIVKCMGSNLLPSVLPSVHLYINLSKVWDVCLACLLTQQPWIACAMVFQWPYIPASSTRLTQQLKQKEDEIKR